MQEIHPIGGGGGGGGGSRFFGGGDRRLRPHHQQNNQALKCPRCDSINTKFCYYNNYNLSQPRHFCKNCRRYWTKGGVLRNVPVGGGCRKSTKRSSKPKNSSSSETTDLPLPEPEHNSNSHSSSESSSLTAAVTEAVSAPALNSDPNSNNMHESKLLNSVLDANALEQAGTGDCGGGGIFSEIGNFTSLIASSSTTTDALAFGFGNNNGVGIPPDASLFQWQHHHPAEQELKLQGNILSTAGGGNGGGFGSLDWHSGGADHQGLFDLPNTVDQAYWNHTHWSDHDNSTLFHLP